VGTLHLKRLKQISCFSMFFCDGQICFAHHKKQINKRFKQSQNRYVVMFSCLLIQVTRVELRAKDRVRSEEPLGTCSGTHQELVEPVGNPLGIKWELHENTSGATKIQNCETCSSQGDWFP
jgi:hypothetical protein